MKIPSLWAILLFASAPCAWQAQLPAEPDPCASPGTTPAVGWCIHRQFEEADAEMNRVYGQVLSALEDGAARAELRKAQRAWLQYRDASAQFMEARHRGGTGVGAYRDQHLIELTKERTATLKAILEEAA